MNNQKSFRQFLNAEKKGVLVDSPELDWDAKPVDEFYDVLSLYKNLTEATKKPKLNNAQKRGDIGDGHWDIAIIHKFYEKQSDGSKHIIKKAGQHKLPDASTSTPWPIMADATYRKAFGGYKPNANIGRGECLLYYLFNYQMKDLDWVKIVARKFRSFTPSGFKSLSDFFKEDWPAGSAPLADFVKWGGDPKNKSELTDMCYSYVTNPKFVAWSSTLGTRGILNKKLECWENPAKGSGPDLIIKRGSAEVPVEVKGYKSLRLKFKVGMVGESGMYKPLTLFSSLYSFYNLFKAFGDKDVKVLKDSAVHCKALPQILDVFSQTQDIINALEAKVKPLPEMFKSLKKHLTDLEDIIEGFADHPSLKSKKGALKKAMKDLKKLDNQQEVAKIIFKGIVLHELDRKPGEGGMYANLDNDGDIYFTLVTYDGISDEFEDIGKVSIEEKNLKLSFADLGVE